MLLRRDDDIGTRTAAPCWIKAEQIKMENDFLLQLNHMALSAFVLTKR